MAEKDVIELLVEGGKAAPGPATAPRLSAYKLNIGDVFKQVNERTKEYSGIQVPVKIVVDKKTKEVSIEVGTPPVSSLIKKELGIVKVKKEKTEKKVDTAAPAAGITEKKEGVKKEIVILGDLSMEQVLKIAKMKKDNLLAKDLKNAVKQILGTANSMNGILVVGKKPKDVIKEVDEGKWDQLIK